MKRVQGVEGDAGSVEGAGGVTGTSISPERRGRALCRPQAPPASAATSSPSSGKSGGKSGGGKSGSAAWEEMLQQRCLFDETGLYPCTGVTSAGHCTPLNSTPVDPVGGGVAKTGGRASS